MSAADEINGHLDAIVAGAAQGEQLLNEDEPDFVRLREILDKISMHGRESLNLMTRIRSAQKK